MKLCICNFHVCLSVCLSICLRTQFCPELPLLNHSPFCDQNLVKKGTYKTRRVNHQNIIDTVMPLLQQRIFVNIKHLTAEYWYPLIPTCSGFVCYLHLKTNFPIFSRLKLIEINNREIVLTVDPHGS